MTAILGLSAFYHDSAACLVVDGDIVAAAQEERFSRLKHDPGFPAQAAAYCLKEGGLSAQDLDFIAFYEKPLRKFDRLLETYLAYAPSGFSSFAEAMPLWLNYKLHMRSLIREGLGGAGKARLIFTGHHESHAASAFFPSPFEESAILTLDGVGEWTTASWGTGRDNRLALEHEINFPHSLGLLYSAFTYYCGFKVNGGEHKLMGLAPYGKPVYAETIRGHLIDLKADGSFRLGMDYFNYCQGLTMTGERFHRLFGGPPRSPESPLEQRHLDLAASIQAVTEEAVLRMGRHVHEQTGQKRLVMAGGVALNCVANGRLLREGPFENIWIQPAAGDAGGSLGAALFTWHQLLGRPRRPRPGDSQKGSLLGPSYGDEEVAAILSRLGARAERPADEASLLDLAARLLADGKVVGWFQGRMEFGPRALGARSILADPRSPAMQAALNLKIKFRETFRPYAPSVPLEQAREWFGLKAGQESPYMLLTAPVLESRRVAVSPENARTMAQSPDLRERVSVARSTIPAVTHLDYSARLQTVDAERNPRFLRLLKRFHQLTGCPVLVNTSMNVRGEPIVRSPEEAYRCFSATAMDALVLEDHLLLKKPDEIMTDEELRRHLAQFELD